MENWITDMMNDFGYLGVFLLIALENLFPPIPSEVILTFGGFMTTYTGMTIAGVVVASTIGSVTGAVALYFVGYLIDVTRMEKIINRWGRILRLTNDDVRKAYGWFEKYGVWTVFLCRLIPLIRSLISIPAGSTRMNFWLFIALTTLGSLIWNVLLVNVGAAVGASWETIVGYMDIYSNVVYALLALGVVIALVWFIRKRKKV
ncbi:DedA family protein [Paenibacillus arenilitoris]|uniref:DedA family protein n=1 Tax=Paenibacillus arenilitoris TaxID=2772299 RepID=A0A927CKK6_9BACL|nr:DedA family protein [Paenibacillus arenilitoris]MBD2869259.1 DedA family protein [Paenibacillus arenilitoris]